MQDLLRQLADEDAVVRMAAARDLARRGTLARPAAEALAARLTDPEAMVRAMAAAAIGKIGPDADAPVDVLIALLDDPVFPVRFWASEALGRLGAEAARALPRLDEIRSGDANKAVRGAAAIACRRIADGTHAPGRDL